MRKSRSVPVQIVSMVASMALAAGCGSPTHQKLCGDNKGVAVEPEKCEQEVKAATTHGHGYVPMYHWYYAPYGRSYAPGSPLTGASMAAPTGKGVHIASPSSPVRGGFGGSARHSFGS